ncbi:MAG: hypothetical protein ACLRFM_04225 [Alphaproteobacteria bacterium]
MKKLLCFLGCVLTVCAANAAGRDASRASIAPRAIVGTAHLNDFKSSLKFLGDNIAAPDTPVPAATVDDVRDTRDAERAACMSNNGWGMGNTFVWASRFSNTSNYASMVEDVENPENNVCWVLVGLRSNDGRVNMSDMPTKYFEMGTNITCGSWVDEALVEKRILDAKKTTRTLATVAGSVGGAGVGVGAMELFGNRALSNINGLEGLQGQKALSGDDLFVSQLKELKNSKQGADKARYDSVVAMLKNLQEVCQKNTSADGCSKVPYEKILGDLGENQIGS